MCGICGLDCHVSLETFDGGLYCSKGLIHVFFFFGFFLAPGQKFVFPGHIYLESVQRLA